MSRPRKIPEEIREQCRQVAYLRLSMPSDKELARKAQCSVSAIQKIMHKFVREQQGVCAQS